MFAVALWEARRRRLTLARDRFGIKPLYYRDVEGELSFASELDALPQGDIDRNAVEAFLAFNSIPAPLSIFRDIRKLTPGHTLTWEEGRAALARYARPGPLAPRDTTRTRRSCVEECRARLRDSVRAHLIADVPVGVLLSGGVDSGALDCARSGGVVGGRSHVLDRLRRVVVRRARRRTRRRRPLCDPPPRARPRSRRRAAAPGARRSVRRAVRRLVGTPDLPGVEARRRGREGRALGRRRRRALRRLLHVRRRHARRPHRPARDRRATARRAPPDLDEATEHRLQGEALRARRAPAAARAPPRLEGDLRGGCTRRADGLAAARSTRSRPTAHASPRPRATSS